MSLDITTLLEQDWPDDHQNFRKLTGTDGSMKLQVRVDQGAFQGILQMDLDGRPDGRKPHGIDFALDFYKEQLEQHENLHETDEAFFLNPEECAEIFDESLRIYQRYAFLLQIEDYERVVRDTERNMEAFRFVNTYAEREEDRNHLEKWWPYVLRIHATARIMDSLNHDDFRTALEIVNEAESAISALKPVEAEEFEYEKDRSEKVLEELKKEIENRKPEEPADRLHREMATAIANEDYERAAELRDQLRDMDAPVKPQHLS